MTKQQLERRRSIVKKIAVGLPIAGFVIPFAIGLKNKELGAGAFFGIFGLIFGGILAAGVIMVAMPDIEEQEKIK